MNFRFEMDFLIMPKTVALATTRAVRVQNRIIVKNG